MAATGSPPGPGRSRRPRRRAATLVAAVAAAATLLGACGQRGPLYLPDSRPAKKLAPTVPGDSTRSDAPAAPAIQDA